MKALQEEDTFDIPLTSLIDVVFLLLLFFLVATNFNRSEMEHSITLPQSESGENKEEIAKHLLVTVRADGTLVVNGSIVNESQLRTTLHDFATAYPRRPAVIRADASVTYQSVMRVFGICRGAGITSIDLPVLDPGESQ